MQLTPCTKFFSRPSSTNILMLGKIEDRPSYEPYSGNNERKAPICPDSLIDRAPQWYRRGNRFESHLKCSDL